MSSESSQLNPPRHEWVIAAGDLPPQRLEKFLQQKLPGLSRRNIQALIMEGLVLVDHRTTDKGYRLQAGNHLKIRLPGPVEAAPVPEPALNPTIIYQDRDLIVVDKPALVPTHPLSPFETGTLANGLVARFPNWSVLEKNHWRRALSIAWTRGLPGSWSPAETSRPGLN
ncbi:MAG: hypothetical protein EHM75_11505 [Desulfobacteraceae bacterium]|nr:MAG: hypothetical protein EHM75_11505 [Desulfobacteraceae bacterium]